MPRIGSRLAVFMILATAATACDILNDEPLPMPTELEVRTLYEEHPGMTEIRLSGNVVTISFTQAIEQLWRGGSLWARVGPYIHLFSPSTRKLLERYPGVAAVRVITHAPAGTGRRSGTGGPDGTESPGGSEGNEIARAMLVRDTLSQIEWRRSLNLLGHALQAGSNDPSRLMDLADWGESHTDYQYNPDYVPVSG